MAKNHLGEDPITVHVHGLRNQIATFPGADVELLVGAMAPSSYIPENAVLLTVEGKATTGERIDIEIAVPVSQIDALIARLQHRAGIKGH
jgi:hypothetical protein